MHSNLVNLEVEFAQNFKLEPVEFLLDLVLETCEVFRQFRSCRHRPVSKIKLEHQVTSDVVRSEFCRDQKACCCDQIPILIKQTLLYASLHDVSVENS